MQTILILLLGAARFGQRSPRYFTENAARTENAAHTAGAADASRKPEFAAENDTRSWKVAAM
jgi:hypothetical protein